MATDKFTIDLSGSEKQLFAEWLQGRENLLKMQLQEVQSLQARLQNTKESQLEPPTKKSPIEQTAAPRKRRTQQLSWTGKIIQVFQQLQRSLISKEIIDWFEQNDATVKGKDRAFISKSVTSKLAVLEEKGILKKELINKKYVYTLMTAEKPNEPLAGLFEDSNN